MVELIKFFLQKIESISALAFSTAYLSSSSNFSTSICSFFINCICSKAFNKSTEDILIISSVTFYALSREISPFSFVRSFTKCSNFLSCSDQLDNIKNTWNRIKLKPFKFDRSGSLKYSVFSSCGKSSPLCSEQTYSKRASNET